MNFALRCSLNCVGKLIYSFNVSLRLLENRTFPGGTVLLRYAAKHD